MISHSQCSESVYCLLGTIRRQTQLDSCPVNRFPITRMLGAVWAEYWTRWTRCSMSSLMIWCFPIGIWTNLPRTMWLFEAQHLNQLPLRECIGNNLCKPPCLVFFLRLLSVPISWNYFLMWQLLFKDNLEPQTKAFLWCKSWSEGYTCLPA